MTDTVFAARLLNGERVLWSGRPAQGILFTKQDIFLIPFTLLWGGFALVWEAMVLTRPHVPLLFALWGVPFVLAGLFFIAGRFLLDAYCRANLFYAVTDRRVLILRERPFPAFTALFLHQLAHVQSVTGTAGRATIMFGSAGPARFQPVQLVPSLDSTPKFLGIENGAHVLNLIFESGGATARPEAGKPFAVR